MNQQVILFASETYEELDKYLKNHRVKKIFLVCGNSIRNLKIGKYFQQIEMRLGIKIVYFKDFTPNPQYESVEKGVKLFNELNCDIIIAVGGGSAIDIAKCIKLFCNMDNAINYLEQKVTPNTIKILAVPTTAGTGSEATHFAVIYYNGIKQSVSDDSLIPSAVLMDATTLETLPDYQRKVTMMDALCHAIESYWSVNSTEISKNYSKQAIKRILAYKDAYLSNQEIGNREMLLAANIAGKAINITQTTAGHAMCYKLTSLYKIAHGHAAALCLPKLWAYMIENIDKCVDVRGSQYLQKTFNDIAIEMGCESVNEAIVKFQRIVKLMGLFAPQMTNYDDYKMLNTSVNQLRLKNNPIELDSEAIDKIYHDIFKE